ncbi:MAG: sulfurtransferase complex subunit TusD [Gammaproteobacteria bacterium]|nr:sulfurtransferase complex subunit TusD [Gammaproteobacteria bacterium]MYF01766.1 sulfurtransferase complex subunit TusD [Gammaproteobacteria bacterium]MYI77822.1 sulfurtransferase complex subunit TusD [Gammaproteobacteria bacterium]
MHTTRNLNTTTISLLVQGSPFSSNACEQALEFAKATVRSDYRLYRVFFYKDAVLIANKSHNVPSDERNIQREWIEFASDQSVQLCVCVGACERRGIHNQQGTDSSEGFEIVGLGQLTEAMFKSDRLVTFQ